MLDDFTAENGATAVRPGTQIKSEYPWDSEDFHKHKDVPFFMNLQVHSLL